MSNKKSRKKGKEATAETPQKRTCGTQAVHFRLLATNPEYVARRAASENHALEFARLGRMAARTGITVIPVVVHVVYHTAAQNISDAQINSQIDVLNKDYRKANTDIGSVPGAFAALAADARVEFKLADKDPANNPTNGITRTNTATVSFSDDDKVKKATTGGHDAWPSDKFLNIWVCNLGGGLLGYAQFPGGPADTDGVVITHTGFGTTGTAAAPFNLGRTATHEIGHFLNLRHIWGDDGSGCSGSDLVGDTPNQGGPNYGNPAFPHVTCGNGPDGDMFMNYMDYVDDDAMFMFTAGQVTRMQACLDSDRNTLGYPKALTLKFADDPKFKFTDDGGTLKVVDDPKFKFTDDPKFKFTDDPMTKTPGSDWPTPAGPVFGPGPEFSPFILATPHHSMAWARSFPQAYRSQLSAYEQQLRQIAQVLTQYQQGQSQRLLTDAERQAAEQLHQEYQRIMTEYTRMAQG